MFYIIGLGNPGIKYINTRHNAGFLFLDYLNSKFIKKSENHSLDYSYLEGKIKNHKVTLIKPQTFMNLSGKIINQINNDFKNKKNFVVIHDDIDIELGKIKIKDSGSSGGHNGIKSIINALEGDRDFVRIRIGINNRKNNNSTTDYVLQTFSDNELEIINEVFSHAFKGLNEIMKGNIEHAMNICNGINVVEDDSE
ncbi:MAG TPA: aminoacyl-tRNA hydrolase [Candidatus Mcinerneyibacterium sp.]|nr:aminoacyl-tRNA hydrolase [Candidatus Mcinerneyibacterium sp.]